ncbi:Peptidase M20 domain-containing protein 2 [Purpureocillium lavendulum]|uniref:Peptidase M20 domain-containing protein 2 n=1 Tax=Purpureocillium lavendulum TaxID=1247861 RepID=A0AB34FQI5_9HYPO|nr:Peptidase M20 domain-containing protein 2 [Purpureocillium lavendulum]
MTGTVCYFTAYEDLAHSVVEYIPLVGTLYSLARGAIAAVEHNQKHYWASVADAIEGSIRDVVLVAKFAEPVPVTLVHVMAESFTEKLIEIYHSKPKVPEVGINYMLSRNTTYIIISEARTQEKAAAFFKGMAKGVFYFYGANFVGTLWETNYAWAGEQIRLEFTRGVYDGAPVFLSWTWTRDSNGIAHRPEVVYAVDRRAMSSQRETQRKKVSGFFSWGRNPATSTSWGPDSPAEDASSLGSTADKGGRSPENIRDEIARTWKTVWEALFKRHPRASFERFDELRLLCQGAGATLEHPRPKQLLGALDGALDYDSPCSSGMRSLKVEKNTSTQQLDALLELLIAYVPELAAVDEIEARLRDAQIGLREPTVEEWHRVKNDVLPLAEPVGRRIRHYNARLQLLQIDIEKEALAQWQDGGHPEWIHFESLVYPRKKHGLSGS